MSGEIDFGNGNALDLDCYNGEITEHEIKVLEMFNGDIPLVPGAATNACVEFLSHSGLMTRMGTVTDKGKKFLKFKHRRTTGDVS